MDRPPLELAGIRIQRLSKAESFARVAEALEQEAVRVAWVYAHCILLARENPEYRAALNSFEFLFNDGVGIELAGYLKGFPVLENLCGTDWIPEFLEVLAQGRGVRLYLLGAKPEVVSRAARLLGEKPGIAVVGYDDGYFLDPAPILTRIEAARPEVLLVAMGVPRQELFLYRHWERLRDAGVRLGIAGGAVLDFLTGALPRAPLWVRKLRGEWLYRLCTEPRRLYKRYLLGNPRFLYYLFREELRGHRNLEEELSQK